jgi:Putative adhesin
MKTIRTYLPLMLATAFALAPLRSAFADETTTDIAFSDPSKPGTLKIRVWHGDVSIHGADVKAISVKSESAPASPTPRKDGMRVLSSSSGFLLSEKNNVATLEYGSDGWTGGSADFDITVPRSTSIVVGNSAHGDFECSDVSGDVDVRTMSGDVKLDGISGGATVETMNGEIDVKVKELTASRPLSFTSMHGEITIHLPEASKADVRFRTHRGVILTNFDDKVLVTKTVVSHEKMRALSGKDKGKQKDKTGADLDLSVNVDLGKGTGSVLLNAPAAPAAPAAPEVAAVPAVPEKPSESSDDSDGDWHAEVRDSIRMAADEAAMAAKEAAEAVHEGMAEFHAQFNGGNFAPLPPMTGGKVVSGTLNGGGVSIQAATLNGDIILKRID